MTFSNQKRTEAKATVRFTMDKSFVFKVLDKTSDGFNCKSEDGSLSFVLKRDRFKHEPIVGYDYLIIYNENQSEIYE